MSSSCMKIPILLGKLKKVQEGSLSHPYSLDLAPNLVSKNLSGTRFSSKSDVKTATENWLNGEESDFSQVGLNQLVPRSDKCLNRFGDYAEKLSASRPINSLWILCLSLMSNFYYPCL
ncbi:hypothetical protein AVEN_52109-1 [Araneus ventricosus]|uniref:Uncharacterized protein n=1 Tax=Araneus ventricosus TaxID=182803 RepID=A0A4Y2V664_ARAVE|nr:hypothetical protein AVEN_52109-1 [Araneus ventricosus]